MNNRRIQLRRYWTEKFAHALRGTAIGIRGQSSFAVHLTCAALVITAAAALRVGWLQWCLLLLCIALVLSAEMFNSALESMAKAVDQRHNPHLADALDIASGAVLLAAIGAAGVGLIIFLNRAIALFLGA